MTDQLTLYSNALDSLIERTPEIKEAFDNRANQNGVIDAEYIAPLLNDLSVLFSVDFGSAVELISKENANITNYFDLDAINFEAFMELIKIWLQNIVRNEPKVPTQDSLGSRVLTNEEQNYDRRESQSMNRQPIYFAKNRERLNELIQKHRDRFADIFYQRQNQETGRIFVFDWLTFIQECLACDSYVLKERASDEHDFFRGANSYNKLASIVQGYLINMRGADGSQLDIQQIHLSFEECFDILDYWFQVDDHVVLYDERNDNQNQTSLDGDVRSIMMETIEKYQKMMTETTNEVDRQILQTTLDTLMSKLRELETGEVKTATGKPRRESSKSVAKRREDRKTKALRETFDFYAKQQVSGGKAPTFSKIQHQFNTINLGKFSIILKNFRIKIDNLRLKEIFKKVSHNSEDLTFDEFIVSYIAIIGANECVGSLQKVSKEAELVTEVKVVKPNPDIRKEYKPDSYKKTLNLRTDNRSVSKRRDDSEKRREDNVNPSEIWDHMGLYDGKYRKCLQTVQLAFNSAEKETFRLPPDSLTYKFREKLLDGKSADEIKVEVNKRNELRKLVKDAKVIEKSLLKNYKETPSRNTTDRLPTTDRREDSYAMLKAQRSKVRTVPEVKLTLGDIGKCNHGEMKKMGLNVAFDPFDLINENDEEDNIYLAEYSLEADIMEKKLKDEKYLKVYEEQEKVKPKKPLPGKYSYLDNTKQTRVGTEQGKLSAVPPINPKPASLADIDYGKVSKSTSGIPPYDTRSQMLVSQSVKHIGIHPNIRNLQNITYESPHGRVSKSGTMINRQGGYPSVATPMRYPSEATPIGYSAANILMGRMGQVQEDARRKETQLIHNILNNQNMKVEKGLRVARR